MKYQCRKCKKMVDSLNLDLICIDFIKECSLNEDLEENKK